MIPRRHSPANPLRSPDGEVLVESRSAFDAGCVCAGGLVLKPPLLAYWCSAGG